MFSLQIVLLGLALAIDAAIVTFAVGLVQKELPMGNRFQRGLYICFLFGFFQALMIWLGANAGYYVAFSGYGYYFQIAVGSVFFYMAYKLVKDSSDVEEKKLEWSFVPVIMLAIATSIDALISGVSLGGLPNTERIALEIGVITFIICGVFYLLSQRFQRVPDKWLLRLAGLIFIVLGVQIFWAIRHLFLRG